MKEIKAYIRTSCLEQTVTTLKEKGAPGITVVTVHPVGYGFEARFPLERKKFQGGIMTLPSLNWFVTTKTWIYSLIQF